MLNTKDVTGYLRPLSAEVEALTAVSIPGESNTLTPGETVRAARSVGMVADEAASVADALHRIVETSPRARVLICGSLYLAGGVLRENG
jgi:dihydrofolate synthase/folylpolyglutamate synthase